MFFDLIFNKAIWIPFVNILIAQLLKTVTFYINNKKFNFKMFVNNGGMPSSHSAGVCSLATVVFFLKGAGSIEFAISLALAMVVMHDAVNVRGEAGKHSVVLNELMEEIFHPDMEKKNLKTLIGHTPLQVILGAFLGLLLSILFLYIS